MNKNITEPEIRIRSNTDRSHKAKNYQNEDRVQIPGLRGMAQEEIKDLIKKDVKAHLPALQFFKSRDVSHLKDHGSPKSLAPILNLPTDLNSLKILMDSRTLSRVKSHPVLCGKKECIERLISYSPENDDQAADILDLIDQGIPTGRQEAENLLKWFMGMKSKFIKSEEFIYVIHLVGQEVFKQVKGQCKPLGRLLSQVLKYYKQQLTRNKKNHDQESDIIKGSYEQKLADIKAAMDEKGKKLEETMQELKKTLEINESKLKEQQDENGFYKKKLQEMQRLYLTEQDVWRKRSLDLLRESIRKPICVTHESYKLAVARWRKDLFYTEIEKQPDLDLPLTIREKLENEQPLTEEDLNVYRSLYYKDEEKEKKNLADAENQTEELGIEAQGNAKEPGIRIQVLDDTLERISSNIEITEHLLTNMAIVKESVAKVNKEVQTEEEFERDSEIDAEIAKQFEALLNFDENFEEFSNKEYDEFPSLLKNQGESKGNASDPSEFWNKNIKFIDKAEDFKCFDDNFYDTINQGMRKLEIEKEPERQGHTKDDIETESENELENEAKNEKEVEDEIKIIVQNVLAKGKEEEEFQEEVLEGHIKKEYRKLENKEIYEESGIDEEIKLNNEDQAKPFNEENRLNTEDQGKTPNEENRIKNKKSSERVLKKTMTEKKGEQKTRRATKKEEKDFSQRKILARNKTLNQTSNSRKNPEILSPDVKSEKQLIKSSSLHPGPDQTLKVENERKEEKSPISLNVTENHSSQAAKSCDPPLKNAVNHDASKPENKKVYRYSVEDADKQLLTKFTSNFNIKRDSLLEPVIETRRKSAVNIKRRESELIQDIIKGRLGPQLQKSAQNLYKAIQERKKELEELEKKIKQRKILITASENADEINENTENPDDASDTSEDSLSEPDVLSENPDEIKENPEEAKENSAEASETLKDEKKAATKSKGFEVIHEENESFEEQPVPEGYHSESWKSGYSTGYTEGKKKGFKQGKMFSKEKHFLKGFSQAVKEIRDNEALSDLDNASSKQSTFLESPVMGNLKPPKSKFLDVKTQKESTKFSEFNFAKQRATPRKIEIPLDSIKVLLKKLPGYLKKKSKISRKMVFKMICGIYENAHSQIQAEEIDDLIVTCYEDIAQKYGLKKVSDRKFLEFISAVIKNKDFKRCLVFLKLMSLGTWASTEDYSRPTVALYLEAYRYMINSKIGIVTNYEETDDKAMFPLNRAVECIREKLEGKVEKPVYDTVLATMEHNSISDPRRINTALIELELVLEAICDNFETHLKKSKSATDMH